MNLGLRGKLLLSLCSLLLISLAISNSVITINSYRASKAEAKEKILITDTGVFAAHPMAELVGRHVKEFFSQETVDALSKGEYVSETIVSAKNGKNMESSWLLHRWGRTL